MLYIVFLTSSVILCLYLKIHAWKWKESRVYHFYVVSSLYCYSVFLDLFLILNPLKEWFGYKIIFFASIFIYFSFKKRILKDINLRYCIIRFYKRRSFYPICIANLLYTVNIKQFKKWWWCKYGIIFFQNEKLDFLFIYIFC